MVFSLFNKNRKDRKDRDGDTLRGDTLSPRTRTGPSTIIRPTENLADARKRQAEMAAKIDAIESEMAAEFPPLSRSTTRKPNKPAVPAGVDVPDAVKREPSANTSPPNTVTAAQNPPTFTPTNLNTDIAMGETDKIHAVELSSTDVAPIVEEVAILFANGQHADCIRALRDELTRDPSVQMAWLLLFEVFQQTGNYKEFESLALDYSVRFESSPPGWRDMRRDTGVKKPSSALQLDPTEVALPTHVTADNVRELDSFKKLLKPGARAKLNFDKLNTADEAGAHVLRDLLRTAEKSGLPITISGATQAAFSLRSKLVVNERDQPQSVWLATLDLYHLLGWQQQFDDLAVDYAVTFEVSPPSYEGPPKHIHIAGALNAEHPTLPINALVQNTHPQLKGDVLGRAADAIATLDLAANEAERIEVDCSELGRVDFSAAGALLNWLLSAHARGKQFSFIQVHVLAAALFSVVGINGVADVVRRRA